MDTLSTPLLLSVLNAALIAFLVRLPAAIFARGASQALSYLILPPASLVTEAA